MKPAVARPDVCAAAAAGVLEPQVVGLHVLEPQPDVDVAITEASATFGVDVATAEAFALLVGLGMRVSIRTLGAGHLPRVLLLLVRILNYFLEFSIHGMRARAAAAMTAAAGGVLDMEDAQFGALCDKFAAISTDLDEQARGQAMWDALGMRTAKSRGSAVRQGLQDLQTFFFHAIRVGVESTDTKVSQRNDWASARFTAVDSLEDIPDTNTSNLVIITDDGAVHFHVHRNTKTGARRGRPRVERELLTKSPQLAQALPGFSRWAFLLSPGNPALFLSVYRRNRFGLALPLATFKARQSDKLISCNRARDACKDHFHPNAEDEAQRQSTRADAWHSERASREHYGDPARRVRPRPDGDDGDGD